MNASCPVLETAYNAEGIANINSNQFTCTFLANLPALNIQVTRVLGDGTLPLNKYTVSLTATPIEGNNKPIGPVIYEFTIQYDPFVSIGTMRVTMVLIFPLIADEEMMKYQLHLLMRMLKLLRSN